MNKSPRNSNYEERSASRPAATLPPKPPQDYSAKRPAADSPPPPKHK